MKFITDQVTTYPNLTGPLSCFDPTPASRVAQKELILCRVESKKNIKDFFLQVIFVYFYHNRAIMHGLE